MRLNARGSRGRAQVAHRGERRGRGDEEGAAERLVEGFKIYELWDAIQAERELERLSRKVELIARVAIAIAIGCVELRGASVSGRRSSAEIALDRRRFSLSWR